MARDWRDDRIAELEADGARKDARISELEAQVAAKDARIVVLEGQVATLTAHVEALMKQVAELTEKLNRNSRNSHMPPSTDPPGSRGGSDKDKPAGRKRGGQPGHGGSRRALLPPEQVDEVIDVFPSHCDGCANELAEVHDPGANTNTSSCRRSNRTRRNGAFTRSRVRSAGARRARRTTRRRSLRRPSGRASWR